MHQENKIITIEEISKVNLCVGRIVSAEQIPNKQKILKTVVDIGSELRDVVVGASRVLQTGSTHWQSRCSLH